MKHFSPPPPRPSSRNAGSSRWSGRSPRQSWISRTWCVHWPALSSRALNRSQCKQSKQCKQCEQYKQCNGKQCKPGCSKIQLQQLVKPSDGSLTRWPIWWPVLQDSAEAELESSGEKRSNFQSVQQPLNQSDRRCRKKWVNRIGGHGFPILQTKQLLPSSQSNSETEGGGRVIDFSKWSQNRHCSERRWNPIRKGILLTIKSQNWRINKIVRPALFCWWNIGDNFSHFHLAVTSQHILFDVALLRCSNVTVKDPEGQKWQFFLYIDIQYPT